MNYREWIPLVAEVIGGLLLMIGVIVLVAGETTEDPVAVATAVATYYAPTTESSEVRVDPTSTPMPATPSPRAPEVLDLSFVCSEAHKVCIIWLEGEMQGDWFRYRLEISADAVPWELRRGELHLQLALAEMGGNFARYEKVIGGITVFVESEFRPLANYAPQVAVTIGAGDWKTGAIITLDRNAK